jgi:AcrR family transcriptional regulator
MSHSVRSARSGLRAEKKEQTEARILANAIAQFRSRGVRGAGLAEVARQSRVSAATLFNYFPTKGALAEAWVRREIDEMLETASRDLGDHGLRSAMRNLCRQLASLVSQDRAVRLEAWSESGRAMAAPLSSNHPLVLALGREQERDRVRRDIPAQTLGEMLIDAIEGGMISCLRGEANEAEFARTLRARVDLILDGARKKNERVAAPTAGAPRRRAPSR